MVCACASLTESSDSGRAAAAGASAALRRRSRRLSMAFPFQSGMTSALFGALAATGDGGGAGLGLVRISHTIFARSSRLRDDLFGFLQVRCSVASDDARLAGTFPGLRLQRR